MSDQHNCSPYRESPPPSQESPSPSSQSASKDSMSNWPPPPGYFPRRRKTSAYRRQAFLCNVVDSVIPKHLANESHIRHRSINGFHPTIIGFLNSVEGLKSHDEVDEWVIIDDTNSSSSSSAGVQVPANLPPNLIPIQFDLKKPSRSQPSPGFETQKIVGGREEQMRLARSHDMDFSHEISGRLDQPETAARRYNTEKPELRENKGSSSVRKLNCGSGKYAVLSSQTWDYSIGTDFASNENEGNLVVSEAGKEGKAEVHQVSNRGFNQVVDEIYGDNLDDAFELEQKEEFDEVAWIDSYNSSG